MEHKALSEEASFFKQCVVEMEGVSSILQSTSNLLYTSQTSIFVSSPILDFYMCVL